MAPHCRQRQKFFVALFSLVGTAVWILWRASQDKGDYHSQRHGNKHGPIFHQHLDQQLPVWWWHKVHSDYSQSLWCEWIHCVCVCVCVFFFLKKQRTWKNVLTSVSTTNCQVFQFVCVCVSVCSNILTVHKQHCVCMCVQAHMCVSWLKVCVCVDTYESIFQEEALSSDDVRFSFADLAMMSWCCHFNLTLLTMNLWIYWGLAKEE